MTAGSILLVVLIVGIIMQVVKYKNKPKRMKYRKKPVVIDAFQWTGDNLNDFDEWLDSFGRIDTKIIFNYTDTLVITTLEGNMTASPGDYIIRGVNGEFYPCKPDIFEKTYEPA